MQKILENALEIGRKYIPEGECASYIPELAKADKNHLGVCIRTRGMETFSAGDTKERFTIQSISKVITLMVALQHCGFDKVFEKMNMEPSGDAFNSLVKLDLTSDKPFNPMINAGAITTAGYLVPDVSFEDMLNYARRLCLDKDIVMDEKVFRSEMDHCARNRAIAYLLQSKGILESDVEKSLELYTRMCSLSVTAESLAGLGLVLSNGGRHPETGERLIDKYAVQVAKTIMLTCGMYDGSGEFAVRVGIPSKSGVGGGILAVVEKRMGIGIYGPALNEKGNSIGGKPRPGVSLQGAEPSYVRSRAVISGSAAVHWPFSEPRLPAAGKRPAGTGIKKRLTYHDRMSYDISSVKRHYRFHANVFVTTFALRKAEVKPTRTGGSNAGAGNRIID